MAKYISPGAYTPKVKLPNNGLKFSKEVEEMSPDEIKSEIGCALNNYFRDNFVGAAVNEKILSQIKMTIQQQIHHLQQTHGHLQDLEIVAVEKDGDNVNVKLKGNVPQYFTQEYVIDPEKLTTVETDSVEISIPLSNLTRINAPWKV